MLQSGFPTCTEDCQFITRNMLWIVLLTFDYIIHIVALIFTSVYISVNKCMIYWVNISEEGHLT